LQAKKIPKKGSLTFNELRTITSSQTEKKRKIGFVNGPSVTRISKQFYMT